MQLDAIFAKDVQRPIEGVIKADDTSHLGTEVDEYVLTNEAAKGLELLLEAYTNYTNANGVWISGFFGSGKSHLLKMLAHLLGDVPGQEVPRAQIAETFRAKAQDAFLPALLSKVETIPAKSLLFNIDQKATVIAKDQTDALLSVFVKVFNESRGYYGNQGYVAQFERDLDEAGLYAQFQAAYERIAGKTWREGRKAYITQGRNIDRAYAEVAAGDGGAPTDILRKYSHDYAMSIEDFAEEVRQWLEKQEEDFRLNFFVDEVGQFIGANTHLMLNLQTIAESLNTKCGGRAWVFVTSQEDMDKVVGDRTKQQGNDFSKIQARFATRVKLTSADVEEVIRKRLLEKNPVGEAQLQDLYARQHANFKTLFDFVDGAKTYRNYTDQAHFVGTYPFVSYQFPLFQAAIEGISDHNAFEGRNSSVGERSMLGVVQQVAKDIGNVEVGRLATFDHMFAGIRASLKAAAQRSIDVAERNLENPLAIRLLKALFLVKYVDGFHATPRNLTVLVYDRFGLDLPELSKQVQEALTLLETQTYVQRNGNVYQYLTNEEQVMEEEIKNVDIDASEVSGRLFKMISGDVLRANKLRYLQNNQDFAFGYKLDDQVYGQQRELTIHFITPEYPHEIEAIRAHSFERDELRVVLEPDERALTDLRLLLKTEKYVKIKQTSSLSAIEDQILRSKAALNAERGKELVERIRRSVGKAILIINAAEVSSKSQDPLARVSDGFQDLVSRTYTQLGLLGGVSYTEQQIPEFANPHQSGLIDDHSLSRLAAPADAVLSFLLQRDRLGEQVTAKSVVDAFQIKPYGWNLASIEVTIAWLIGTAQITAAVDGNILKRSEISSVLRNTQKHPHIVLAPQRVFDARKVAAFRTFCIGFFDEATAPKDPLELARHGSEKLALRLEELRALVLGTRYPFVDQLSDTIALLEQVTGKPDEWYLTDFTLGEGLLEDKENLIDPIQGFLNGQQRTIYDGASALLQTHKNNLGYLAKDSTADIVRLLDDPNAFRGARMLQLRQAADALRTQIDKVLSDNRADVADYVKERKKELLGSADYQQASEEAQREAVSIIEGVLTQLDGEDQIALIRERRNSFGQTTYPQLLDMLAASAQPPVTPVGPTSPPIPIKTVSIGSISVPGVHGVLKSQDDVDTYLDALRLVLLDTLNDGKRIAL